MACLFLSSIPFLDLIDSFILLAAEVVAIIYLNEEAHSAFWFMLLLTIMPPVTAIVGGIAACTPCKWDDLVISIGTAVMMNVCFAYFCSDAVIDPVTDEQVMGFGEFSQSNVPPIFFSVTGGVQVLIAIINYAMDPDCKEKDGEDSGAENVASGFQQCCMGGIMPMFLGFQAMLYQLYTPWHPLRGEWYGYCFVGVMWITDVGSNHNMQKALLTAKGEEPPAVSLMDILIILSSPLMAVAGLVANAMALNSGLAADLVYVVPPCQYPAEYWAGTYTGNFTFTGDDTGLLPNKENCTLDNGFGWDDLYTNGSNYATAVMPTDIGIDIGIGPYSPFQTFSDGQGLQMYDFIKREVYAEKFVEWTVNRSYPYNYFFNDHPNAGVRSYDYIYSVMGVISLGLMSCSQLCLIPLQFKALCGGGDGEGGPTLSGIGMPNM